jgi:hypothetical protein
MVNVFDRLANKAFGVVSRVQGYPANWTPTDLSGLKSARVLYKDPTAVSKLLQLEYNPNNFALEYMQGDFPGLKELVDQNNTTPESIVITFEVDPLSQVTYFVREVHTIVDGRNYLALLEKA